MADSFSLYTPVVIRKEALLFHRFRSSEFFIIFILGLGNSIVTIVELATIEIVIVRFQYRDSSIIMLANWYLVNYRWLLLNTCNQRSWLKLNVSNLTFNAILSVPITYLYIDRSC